MSTQLKTWTQNEVDEIINKNENKKVVLFPKGSYTFIKFPTNSRFKSRCEFYDCTFGNNCRFSKASEFHTCKFSHNCKFAVDTKFVDNNEFGSKCSFNRCSIGYESKIGNYALLKNCVTEALVTIGRFSVMSGCTIGHASIIESNCKFTSCTIGHRTSIAAGCMFNNTVFEKQVYLNSDATFTDCTFEGKYKQRSAKPVLMIGPLGSEARTTQFFDCVEGVMVRTGCFIGTINEFSEQVKYTHGNNRFAKQYLLVADFVESFFFPQEDPLVMETPQ